MTSAHAQVVHIIECDPKNTSILLRALELAKRLLHEGNDEVQLAFYERLQESCDKRDEKSCLAVLNAKLTLAHNRLKADMLAAAGDQKFRSMLLPTPAPCMFAPPSGRHHVRALQRGNPHRT